MTLRVVKVGGSLLVDPGFPQRLRRWLETDARTNPAAGYGIVHHVLILGGGGGADWIRLLDERFALGEPTSHDLCVSLLSITARLLYKLVPGSRLVDRIDQLPKSTAGAAANSQQDGPRHNVWIFDPARFMCESENALSGFVLPRTWQSTTDSIAARVATACQADELVLLKARPPAAGTDLRQLAAEGYVDAHFPAAAAPLQRLRFEVLGEGPRDERGA